MRPVASDRGGSSHNSSSRSFVGFPKGSVLLLEDEEDYFYRYRSGGTGDATAATATTGSKSRAFGIVKHKTIALPFIISTTKYLRLSQTKLPWIGVA